jgi:hypothetical protein
MQKVFTLDGDDSCSREGGDIFWKAAFSLLFKMISLRTWSLERPQGAGQDEIVGLRRYGKSRFVFEWLVDSWPGGLVYQGFEDFQSV